MQRNREYQRAGIFLLALLLLPVTALAAPVISTQLSQESVPLNQAVRLNLTVTREGRIQQPHVEGLHFHQVGNMKHSSMVNGRSTRRQIITLLVQADKEGDYTIPPFRLLTNDKNYASAPLHLKVTAPESRQAAMPLSGMSLGLPAVQIVTGTGRQAAPNPAEAIKQSDLARLQVKVKPKIYNGESVPMEVKLLLNPTVRFTELTLPQLSGEDLAIPQLTEEDAIQGQQSVDGQPWQSLTWRTTLSGVKAGKHPLQVEMKGSAVIPHRVQASRRQPRRRIDPLSMTPRELMEQIMASSPFDDPLFGGRTRFISKELDLKKKINITVQPLPVEGQPADFTGAVGQFKLKQKLSRTSFAAGDPVTLTVQVDGKGNFDSVTMPAMEENQAIKSYPPSEKFTPLGWGGGSKTFNQGIIVMNGGVKQLPALHFSWFDPKQLKYVSKRTAPIPIQVSRSSSTPPPVAGGTAAPAVTPAVEPGSDKLPLKSELGSGGSLTPLLLKPWYLCVLTLALLTILAAGVARRWQHSRHRAERAGQRLIANRLSGDLISVERALQKGDGRLFLDTCRVAIQNRLAKRCEMHASAVSASDLRRVLPKDSVLLEVFEMAEKSAYGGEIPSEFEMDQLFPLLKKALEAHNE